MRTAVDVINDLYEERDETPRSECAQPRTHHELLSLGIFSAAEYRSFRRRCLMVALGSAGAVILLRLLSTRFNVSSAIPGVLIGVAIGYLSYRNVLKRRKESFIRSIEFYLPIVMERVVMAVEAGLDIIPAIDALIALDEHESEEKRDPVSRLLMRANKLTESGLRFEQGLAHIAEQVPCSALRHAFIHLAIAQREGGELIMPLRELSDSTQLYYQESAEEQIAKLPVKATVPLLCTFAGLIVCFITTPLIQVMSITAGAMPK